METRVENFKRGYQQYLKYKAVEHFALGFRDRLEGRPARKLRNPASRETDYERGYRIARIHPRSLLETGITDLGIYMCYDPESGFLTALGAKGRQDRKGDQELPPSGYLEAEPIEGYNREDIKWNIWDLD